jgi:hypothetical protein
LGGLPRIGIDLALEPESKPVEIALIGGKFLPRFGLHMRGEGKDVHFSHPG